MPHYSRRSALYATLAKLDELFGRTEEVPSSTAEARQVALELTRAAVSFLDELTSFAPTDRPLRAYLEDLLHRVPGDPLKERQRQWQIDSLGAYPRGGLVDLPCGELRKYWPLLRLVLLPRVEEQASAAPGPPRRRNGPAEGRTFRWRGVDYALSDIRWRLLDSLWAKDTVPEEDVMKAVYDDETLGGSKLRQVTHQTNQWLLGKKIPFKIVRPKNNSLALKRLRGR